MKIVIVIKKSIRDINKNAERISADFLSSINPSGEGLVTEAQQIHVVNKKIYKH